MVRSLRRRARPSVPTRTYTACTQVLYIAGQPATVCRNKDVMIQRMAFSPPLTLSIPSALFSCSG